jgi:hypothetical protein
LGEVFTRPRLLVAERVSVERLPGELDVDANHFTLADAVSSLDGLGSHGGDLVEEANSGLEDLCHLDCLRNVEVETLDGDGLPLLQIGDGE